MPEELNQYEGQQDTAPLVGQREGQQDPGVLASQDQPAQPPVQGQAQSSNWNPTEWQLDYRGQKVTPRDKDHLRQLAQQGYSYSQSMAMLKKQQQDLQNRYSRYQTLEQTFEQHPELANQIWGSVQQYLQQVNQPQQQAQPNGQQAYVPPELLQKVQELDQFRNQYVEKQADQELEAEISQLKSKYADQPWDVDNGDGNGTLIYRVMKHAYDGNYPSLNAAYRDLMWDAHMTNTKAETLKKAQETRQAQTKAGVISGGTGLTAAKPATSGYQSGDDYKTLVSKAVAELTASQ